MNILAKSPCVAFRKLSTLQCSRLLHKLTVEAPAAQGCEIYYSTLSLD